MNLKMNQKKNSTESESEHQVLKYCYKMDLPDLSNNFGTLQKQIYNEFWILVPSKNYDLKFDGFIHPFLNSGLVWDNSEENSVVLRKNKIVKLNKG